MTWLKEQTGFRERGHDIPVAYWRSNYEVIDNHHRPRGFANQSEMRGFEYLSDSGDHGEDRIDQLPIAGRGRMRLHLDEIRYVALTLQAPISDIPSSIEIAADEHVLLDPKGIAELRHIKVSTLTIRRADGLATFVQNKDRVYVEYRFGPAGYGLAKAVERYVLGPSFEGREAHQILQLPRGLLVHALVMGSGAFTAERFGASFPLVTALGLVISALTTSIVVRQHHLIRARQGANVIVTEWRDNSHEGGMSMSGTLKELAVGVAASLVASAILAGVVFATSTYL